MPMENKYYISEEQLEKLIKIFQNLQNSIHNIYEKIEEESYFKFENDMEKFKFIFENETFDVTDDLKFIIDSVIDQKIENDDISE